MDILRDCLILKKMASNSSIFPHRWCILALLSKRNVHSKISSLANHHSLWNTMKSLKNMRLMDLPHRLKISSIFLKKQPKPLIRNIWKISMNSKTIAKTIANTLLSKWFSHFKLSRIHYFQALAKLWVPWITILICEKS